MRIIVVEDEIRIREGICNLLGKMFPQHSVVGSATNGKEGLDLILEKNPDLVITDVKMPVMDGLTMLSVLSEMKVKYKAIVLSAYTDFTYAQKAIRWGVSEYLVKPLVVNDFVQCIKNMEIQIEESNKQQNPYVFEKLDNILLGIIFGGIEVDESLEDFAEKKYGILNNTRFSEVLIYLGKHYDEKLEATKRSLEGFFAKRKNLNCYLLDIPKDRTLLAIIYGYDDCQEIERWFQIGMIAQTPGAGEDSNYGWINAVGMKGLRRNYQTLLQYMDWNIAFGNKILISYPKILNVQTTLCIYPIDIENKLKAALCSFHRSKVYKCLEQFTQYFESGNVYDPKNVKECYVRFIWAILNVAKEISLIDHEQIEQKKILEKIMGSINKEELKDVIEEIYLCIKDNRMEENTELSLNVKRAENIILEYYKTGITLEEIAAKLNLTPEYLGMQFHLEKGVKFSNYIRDFRIVKAKELLIGSKMKVSEVAEKVGYSDAKYFSRVFREATGQLPAEYRKANK